MLDPLRLAASTFRPAGAAHRELPWKTRCYASNSPTTSGDASSAAAAQ